MLTAITPFVIMTTLAAAATAQPQHPHPQDVYPATVVFDKHANGAQAVTVQVADGQKIILIQADKGRQYEPGEPVQVLWHAGQDPMLVQDKEKRHE